MNDEERERVVDALAKGKRRPEEVLRAAAVEPDDHAELRAMADTSELLWLSQHQAPPLSEDPVAAMLGLVPDETCTLDPKAFARARKSAGLKPSGIASRLRQKGWATTDADVFHWETRPTAAAAVPPAVVQTLAQILGRTVGQITTAPNVEHAEANPIEALRSDPGFKGLVARWARLWHLSLPDASVALERRLAMTVHRGRTPDTAQMLESLDALVTATERSAQSAHEPR